MLMNVGREVAALALIEYNLIMGKDLESAAAETRPRTSYAADYAFYLAEIAGVKGQ